ncbi:MAG: Serine/threonine-protein kinase PknB [Lentisphaerae bacterium ADurb.BinA184]|nr:MAG: Serine/threonine-protein kinase PknB [Lentisphaerae bacterium ADurb.BinA184]
MRMRRSQMQELKKIAQGGLARLFLASAPSGGLVVVRELHRHHALRLRTQRHFLRGLHIRRRLSPHPNIVAPLTWGYNGIIPYEIIEYVPGRNLHEMILHDYDNAQTQALHVLRETAKAIAYMHDSNYLHLDVKAENVLVDNTRPDAPPVVKLTDFDLSRRFRGGRFRLRCGTASHMAPEQLRRGTVTFANDIFAYGVMAYYLVTRKMPFSAFSLEEVRRQQVSESFAVVEPAKLSPGLTPKLNWIIMRCLEKDPDQRFPNMAYLLQELGRM